MAAIEIWNRAEKRLEEEKVYGDRWVRWLYETRLGQSVADGVLARRLPSVLYGAYQSSRLSSSKIEPFIREFGIPMAQYEPGPFRTFNEFFIRKFRQGARSFPADPFVFPAPCEARYLAWKKVSMEESYPVKGAWLTPELLLGDVPEARAFEGGPLVIARLCPVDYHRFHFPDDGRILDSWRVPGKLHSVNPAALRYEGRIFFTNERQVSLLETRNFGKLAYIEVGALCVGKIIQSHSSPEFHRGDEKGYFLFGASTVILIGEPGAWEPDGEVLMQTARKRETLIRLGEPLGHRLTQS